MDQDFVPVKQSRWIIFFLCSKVVESTLYLCLGEKRAAASGRTSAGLDRLLKLTPDMVLTRSRHALQHKGKTMSDSCSIKCFGRLLSRRGDEKMRRENESWEHVSVVFEKNQGTKKRIREKLYYQLKKDTLKMKNSRK